MIEKITIGGISTGKTLRILKEAEETGAVILVRDKKQANDLFKTAKECGYKNMKFPITMIDYYNGTVPRDILQTGILIDNVDDILSYIFNDIDIKDMTLTSYSESCEGVRDSIHLIDSEKR